MEDNATIAREILEVYNKEKQTSVRGNAFFTSIKKIWEKHPELEERWDSYAEFQKDITPICHRLQPVHKKTGPQPRDKQELVDLGGGNPEVGMEFHQQYQLN